MTAMRVCEGAKQPVDMDAEEPFLGQLADPEISMKRKSKKKKKDKRKRSISCSTESSCCSTGSKRHKKKKRKHHDQEDEPTSKINPIFLRTHNDTNNTIVSVVCEDYDRWNRIKLTKTSGGWRAMPRTETNKQWSSWDMLVKKGPSAAEKSPCENTKDLEEEIQKPHEDICAFDTDNRPSDTHHEDHPSDSLFEKSQVPQLDEDIESTLPEAIPKMEETDSDVEEVPYIVDKTPVAVVDLCSEEDDEIKLPKIEPDHSEESVKCSENVNELVDENHNDFENVRPSCDLGDADDSVDKRFEFLFSELEATDIIEDQRRALEASQKADVPQDHLVQNCSALMDELEEMCHGIMTERLKIDEPAHKDVLSDIYTFVPTPPPVETKPVEIEEDKISKEVEETPIEPEMPAEKPSGDSPINLVVQESHNLEELKDAEGSALNACELEGLDILWRLPEGTTIHHSKAPLCAKEDPAPIAQPAHQPAKGNATISLVKPPYAKEECTTPVQEEPLNLGIPKPVAKLDPTPPPQPTQCKFEEPTRNNKLPQKKIKHDKCANDSKLLELLNTTEEKSDPLAQLKEILNDPDVSVPDPLLVPRGRLQALIANPAKEIPKLLMQSHQPKLPILDADLLVVSLAHLQYILQNGEGKEADAKLYQQAQLLKSQLGSEKNGIDAAVLNQMLWLPYLSQLDINRTTNPQELLAVMMGYNYPWQQQHPRQQQAPNYDYTHSQQHAAMMQQWHGYGQKNLPTPPIPKAYNEFYKNPQTPGYGVPQQLRPPAPVMPPLISSRTESQHRRVPKHSRSHHHQFRPDSWTIPQTSEPPRLPHPNPPNLPPHPSLPVQQQHHQRIQDVKLPNTSTASQPAPSPPQPQIRPKLKVRDHLVDPNLRPKFLKFDDPHFPPPGIRFGDQHHNLWHPLFSSQEGKYTSPWQWTTPVTVSGD